MDQSKKPQLLLDMQPKKRLVFETFVGLPETLERLRNAPDDFFGHIAIVGLKETGKSHALQAFVNSLGATYCPLGELMSAGQRGIEGYAQVEILCIDDCHLAFGDDYWQNLLSQLLADRAQQTKLTISAYLLGDGEYDDVIMPNKKVVLMPLSVEQKVLAAQKRADFLGYRLSTSAAEWLVKHYASSTDKLMRAVVWLDANHDHNAQPLTPRRLGMLRSQAQLPE